MLPALEQVAPRDAEVVESEVSDRAVVLTRPPVIRLPGALVAATGATALRPRQQLVGSFRVAALTSAASGSTCPCFLGGRAALRCGNSNPLPKKTDIPLKPN